MGNYRFRLSDMMPNAWFYKLRDMSKVRNQNPSHPIKKNLPSSTLNPRKSFYYTTHDSIRMDKNLCNSPMNPKFFDTPFPYDPPRKSSSKKKSKRKTIYMPSPCRKIAPSVIFQDLSDNPVGIKPGTFRVRNCLDGPTSSDDQDFLESLSEFDQYDDDSYDDGHDQSTSPCKLSSSASDIIIDVDETSYASINMDRFTEFNMISELEVLPPIVTKPGKESSKFKDNSSSVHFPTEKVNKNKQTTASPGGRKSVSRSGGVKIRRNGRKISSKKSENGRRKSVKCDQKKGLFYSESFAIVKASFDPKKDFKDSMMEMIVENNIRASEDLEELLACYLSLNSNHYHHLIIKAFEQIWFDMPQLQAA